MSRSMKLGIAAISTAFVFCMMMPEDAEARHRRFGRHRRGGGHNSCCGYVPPSCCGVVHAPVCATGACGVATGACPGGVCGVAGGGYSGGHSAGYGATGVQGQHHANMPPAPGALNGQGTYNQSPTPANGESTFRQDQPGSNGARQNGALGSPSDRPPAPNGATNGSAEQTGGEGDTSAPPAPPQE